jgi:uncharacterized lipoprotein YddW (UPF0748 family)
MLVRRIYESVKKIRPDLIVSAALVPDPKEARVKRYQSWWSWLADGILDVAVPMAYTTDHRKFGDWVDEAWVSVGDRERLWIGIGAYKNPVSETLRQVEEARKRGVGGIAIFSYKSASNAPVKNGSITSLKQIGDAAFRN